MRSQQNKQIKIKRSKKCETKTISKIKKITASQFKFSFEKQKQKQTQLCSNQ